MTIKSDMKLFESEDVPSTTVDQIVADVTRDLEPVIRSAVEALLAEFDENPPGDDEQPDDIMSAANDVLEIAEANVSAKLVDAVMRKRYGYNWTLTLTR